MKVYDTLKIIRDATKEEDLFFCKTLPKIPDIDQAVFTDDFRKERGNEVLKNLLYNRTT